MPNNYILYLEDIYCECSLSLVNVIHLGVVGEIPQLSVALTKRELDHRRNSLQT